MNILKSSKYVQLFKQKIKMNFILYITNTFEMLIIDTVEQHLYAWFLLGMRIKFFESNFSKCNFSLKKIIIGR